MMTSTSMPARSLLKPQSVRSQPSDEELDAYILRRMELLGVDLSVLPKADPNAPADQNRILASARRFLRSTPGAIADYSLEATGSPPVIYPAELTAWATGVALDE